MELPFITLQYSVTSYIFERIKAFFFFFGSKRIKALHAWESGNESYNYRYILLSIYLGYLHYTYSPAYSFPSSTYYNKYGKNECSIFIKPMHQREMEFHESVLTSMGRTAQSWCWLLLFSIDIWVATQENYNYNTEQHQLNYEKLSTKWVQIVIFKKHNIQNK